MYLPAKRGRPPPLSIKENLPTVRVTLVKIAATATVLLVSVRAMRPVIAKARNALYGERARPANPLALLRDIAKLVTLYVRPDTVRYLPVWLSSLRSRQSPLSSQMPWIPYPALAFLQRRLSRDATVLEYGSGGSTLWLAQRAGTVTTVEHDATWHAMVEQELRRYDLQNCTVLLRSPERVDGAAGLDRYPSARMDGSFRAYVQVAEAFADDSLDVVLVDGRSREACLLAAASKLKPGGILMLDDSYRSRYESAMRRLDDWPRTEFSGVRPYSISPSRTTFWVRPPAIQ